MPLSLQNWSVHVSPTLGSVSKKKSFMHFLMVFILFLDRYLFMYFLGETGPCAVYL